MNLGGDCGMIWLPPVLAEFGPVGSLIGVGFGVGIRWCSDYIRKLEADIGELLNFMVEYLTEIGHGGRKYEVCKIN